MEVENLRHGCGSCGFAARGCASDACGEKPVQAESGPISNQLELVTPQGTSKRTAEQSPEHPVAKCQQIEDSEDELIAGGEANAAR